ncbi:MAG: ribosome biogenesis GTPase Der, partial [Gammaproteobacteria bacterium]|nr:ribosome biogenesis GTPase Der [Gammaproteobacteria bacterium]
MPNLPVIAIVGRPNVGKSTLFNNLTHSRDALVAEEPGMTRDRQYGRGEVGQRPYLVIDTGGLTGERNGLDKLIAQQSEQALDEADAVLFLVDGRAGLNAMDAGIADQLRRYPQPVFLVVNKCEGLDGDLVAVEFHALGLGQSWAISSAHGQGIGKLMVAVNGVLPESDSEKQGPGEEGVRIAVVGRPNVGKSTLVNRMVGEDRVLAFDQPGTTRDSISIPFERRQKHYLLIDTAGVRRRSRVAEKIEKFSVIKTLQAIEAANVVILLMDAQAGVTEQDAHLLGYILKSGRALVMAANKWDGLNPEQRQRVREELDRRFRFIDFARVRYISALHGSSVGDLFSDVDAAWTAASRSLSTSRLTGVLEKAVAGYQPPLVKGRRIKLRYAHQGGRNPPVITIHGNQTDSVPDNYRRYLERRFRQELHLEGTPVRLEFKTGENPYKDRKNKLTPGQLKRRQRMIR